MNRASPTQPEQSCAANRVWIFIRPGQGAASRLLPPVADEFWGQTNMFKYILNIYVYLYVYVNIYVKKIHTHTHIYSVCVFVYITYLYRSIYKLTLMAPNSLTNKSDFLAQGVREEKESHRSRLRLPSLPRSAFLGLLPKPWGLCALWMKWEEIHKKKSTCENMWQEH